MHAQDMYIRSGDMPKISLLCTAESADLACLRQLCSLMHTDQLRRRQAPPLYALHRLHNRAGNHMHTAVALALGRHNLQALITPL